MNSFELDRLFNELSNVDFDFLSQDADNERPLKRHGSSSDSSPSSPDENVPALQPPKSKASGSSSTASDSKPMKSSNSNNKTSTTDEPKVDECATSISKSQQSDSQTISFKPKNSTSKSTALIDVVPSPADSVATIVGSDVLSDLDIASGYVSSPSNDCNDVFSPFVDDNITKFDDVNASVMSRGEKTPHTLKKRSSSNVYYKTEVDENDRICYITPIADQRMCPIPKLNWTDNRKLWRNMVQRDERAAIDRSANMFTKHTGLQPRMRAILLDWLIEVCEVYKLHRETFYLTLDYLDRYLSHKEGISKNQLQLIGITCLFIASKIEEIYPPKLHEFAYVTDSACTEEDILQQEFLVLQTLNWCITPMTVIGWAGIYMQLYETIVKNEAPGSDTNALLLINSNKESKSFIYPQFTGLVFAKIAQLLDLSCLDVNINHFPYAMVAAAAFGLVLNKEISEKVSGLSWSRETAVCAKWMEPYYQTLIEEAEIDPVKLHEANEQVESGLGLNHICPNLQPDLSHNIQIHSTSLELFVSLHLNFLLIPKLMSNFQFFRTRQF